MPAEVVYSPQAMGDLDGIWEWVADEQGEPAAAERVVAGILDRVGAARESPLATAPLDAVCRARSGWRFVERHGYLAFFRVEGGRIYVDRVLGGRSDYLRRLLGVGDGARYY